MDIPGLDLSESQLATLEVIGIAGTLLAALLAAVAITQASRQAARAHDALRRERVFDLEIDLILKLIEQSLARVGRAAGRARLTLFPPEEFPACRALMALHPDRPDHDWDAVTGAEVDASVAELLAGLEERLRRR